MNKRLVIRIGIALLMNADGSAPVNLTNSPATDIQPSFSPDGDRIAFATNRDGAGAPGLEIYVMNADGSNPVRYTNNTVEDSNPWWAGAPAPPPVTPTKLKVKGGNLLVGSPGEGLMFKSPNGTCRRLSIDNAGEIALATITCP